MTIFNFNNYRNDDKRLFIAGKMFSFATVRVTQTWLLESACATAKRYSQLLWGEQLRVFATANGFYHVQSIRDDYCGWLREEDVELHSQQRTFNYTTRFATAATTKTTIDSCVTQFLAADSCLQVDDIVEVDNKKFMHVANLGWIDSKHMLAVDEKIAVTITANEQLGRSYLWAGRGLNGIDCSAFVQLSLRRAGVLLPRDSDLQKIFLQENHQSISLDALRTGDLLHTKGHVMLVLNQQQIIHATAYFMRVVVEEIAAFRARIANTNNEITAWRLLQNVNF